MKMAKASEADVKMALELAGALESLAGRWGATMPEAIAKRKTEDGEEEGFSLDDEEHCRRVCEYLIRLTRSASLFRVVGGMTVLLDPMNKIVDPTADTLERHPDYAPKEAVLKVLNEAVEDMRERCAKVAEGFEQTRDWVPNSLYGNIRNEVAARIRRVPLTKE
ncbi:MAG: hypothetical protein HEQ39_09520 [Rhizobacter sp.]